MRHILVAILLLWSPVGAWAQSVQVKPYDQAELNPEFKAFRDALLQAVKARDLEAVVAAAAPDITLSFGEDVGPERFRDFLSGKEDWAGEGYWKDLEAVLSLGGAFSEDGSFAAPYVYTDTTVLPEEVDYFTVFYCIGDKVRMRANPSTEATVVGQLSYDVVVADDPNNVAATDATGRDWFYVRTFDGRKGWVAAQFLRSPYQYRAGFEKRDGRWLMTFFLAGD